MEHFPTLKWRHLFLPTHNGTGIWDIFKTLVSRLYLYVCLEMPTASIPDLAGKDEERDEPGLTAPPSPHLQLTQDRIVLFLISLYVSLLPHFSAPLSPQPCHTQQVYDTQQCPALSPLSPEAAERLGGGRSQGGEGALRAKQELQQQEKRPC